MTTLTARTPLEADARSIARVAVVIVNHHSAAATTRCLEALWRDEPDVPVFVIDNSQDAQQTHELAQLAPRATLVQTTNRGFGAGCNIGIARALATFADLDAVLLLNPDTLPQPGALRQLCATLARQGAGAVGARLLSLDGTRTLFEAGRIRRCTLTRSHARAHTDATEFATECLTGACMLIAADLLRGGLRFDEGYFLYVEDMDLSCAIAARGRTLWVNRDAVVRHADGGTQREPPIAGSMRSRQLYWMTAGKVRFARKWLSPAHRWCFYLIAVVAKPLVGLVAWRSARFLRPYFAGLRDGWRGHCAANSM